MGPNYHRVLESGSDGDTWLQMFFPLPSTETCPTTWAESAEQMQSRMNGCLMILKPRCQLVDWMSLEHFDACARTSGSPSMKAMPAIHFLPASRSFHAMPSFDLMSKSVLLILERKALQPSSILPPESSVHYDW